MGLLQMLQSKRCRITSARKEICLLLEKTHAPISAEEILEKINVAHKTTIYRELAFLEGEGLIQKIEFGDGVRRYERAEMEHHHHLVCIECKKVADVHLAEDLDVQERSIARKTGFKILNHSLEFFGLCSKCK